MITEMTIKRMPVSALKPAKYNPRKDLKPGDPAYEKSSEACTISAMSIQLSGTK